MPILLLMAFSFFAGTLDMASRGAHSIAGRLPLTLSAELDQRRVRNEGGRNFQSGGNLRTATVSIARAPRSADWPSPSCCSPSEMDRVGVVLRYARRT